MDDDNGVDSSERRRGDRLPPNALPEHERATMTDKSLRQLQEEAHRIAVEHGWWEPQEIPIVSWDSGVDEGEKALAQRTFGDQVALLHSELSESLEAFRERGLEQWYVDPPMPDEATMKAFNGSTVDLGPSKPEGAFVELADCIIRILDTAGHYGVDMQALVEEKMAYNETRPFRHGGKAL